MKRLKDDCRLNNDFDLMLKRLEQSGIVGGYRRGKVVYFNEVKRYGFIEADNKKYYLHVDAIKPGRLSPGQYPKRGDCYKFKANNQNRAAEAVKI